jgi:predicted DNA-binding transcriptional regulator AlpA
MTQSHDAPLWLNIKATSKRYGISRANIYLKIKAGKLKCKKIGKLSMVSVVSMDQMFADAEDVKVATAFLESLPTING